MSGTSPGERTPPRPLPASLPDDSRITFNPDRTAIVPPPGPAPPAPPASPPHADRIEFRRIVGRGGFGEVWEAVQVSLGRTVAAKRLRDDLRATSDLDTRREQLLHGAFRWEALTGASLEHPNIVPIYDLGTDDTGRPVLAMKFVRGTPWPDAIAADFATMDVPGFLARHLPILVAVSQAVAFAHSRGIVHRDLKPSQVMVGEFGEVLLMDWGLAVAYDPAALATRMQIPPESIPGLATATSPAGTPAFMAPEQTDATAARVGPWTDVYLLGGTLYYLLTGETPHTAENSAAAFYEASEGRVVAPQVKAPGREVPPDLAELAMRAMQPEPSARIPSVKDFIEGIQGHISGANRRREAEAIAAAVRRRIDTAHGDYRLLTEADTQLQRALTLWPELPGGGALRDRILSTHASAANDHGDLVLARVLAERIADPTQRGAILSENERLADKEHARERQRRHLILGAAVVPFVIMLLTALIYRTRADEQLARAIEQSTRERALRAEQGQAEQAARARLFERINDLRRREGNLAERLARAIPSPEKSNLSGVQYARATQDETLAPSLIAELADLRRQRASTEAEAPGALGEEPFALRLSEANYEFAKSRTPEDAKRAYELFRRLAAEHPPRPEPHTGMGLAAYFAGEITSASLHLADATRKTGELFGTDSQGYGEALELQARILRELDYVQFRGADLAQRAVDVLDGEWARMTLALAGRYRLSGDLDRALRLTSAALELIEADSGLDAQLRTTVAADLGGVYYGLGNYSTARGHFLRALAGLRAQKPPNVLSIVNLLSSIGDTYRFDGDFAEARRYYEECRRIADEAGNLPIQHRALHINSLAGLERRLGNHAQAVALYEEVLDMLRSSLDPGNPLLARAYSNIGPAYASVGRMDDAERAFDSARAILDAIPVGCDLEKGVVYSNIGQLRYHQGRYAEALPVLERARESLSRINGPEHPDVATITANLAFTHQRLGDLKTAESEMMAALRVRLARFRPDHPDIAASLGALGQFRSDAGDDAGGIPLMARGAMIQLAAFGDIHRETRISVGNLVLALRRLGRTEESRILARWLYLNLALGEYPRQPAEAWKQASLFILVSRDLEALPAGERANVLRAARHLAESWPPPELRDFAAEGAVGVADALTTLTLPREGAPLDVVTTACRRAQGFLRELGFPDDDPRMGKLLRMSAARGIDPIDREAHPGASPAGDGTPTSTTEAWARACAAAPYPDWDAAFPEVAPWGVEAIHPGLDESRQEAVRLLETLSAGSDEFLSAVAASP